MLTERVGEHNKEYYSTVATYQLGWQEHLSCLTVEWPVAQLVEHPTCNREVTGSNPPWAQCVFHQSWCKTHWVSPFTGVFFGMSKSQQGVKVWSWNFGNVCSWTKGTPYVCNTFSWELQIFCYNQAKFQPGSCGCQVSHETLISRILIYNSKPRNPIFTQFSACKHSSVEKMSGKFRHPEIVAMETVTDSFFIFNARYLSRGSIHCLEILRILFSKTKGTFYV